MLTVGRRAEDCLGVTAGRIADETSTRDVRCRYIVSMPTKKRSAAQPNSAKQTGKKSLKVLSSKLAYKGKVFSVTTDKIQEPNGITATRDVIRHSGSVVILAVDETGKEPRVLLERQYRYAAQEYLWELPAGRIDPGESALAGAKRELIEETGYRARKWKKILHFFASPGFLDETMTIFLARDLTPGEAQPEADESIECHMVPLSEALDLVFQDKIHDGKALAGVLWLAEARRRKSL
jgi:ADP-ribose pyrophosphatase